MKDPYGGVEPYIATPTVKEPLLHAISDAALIAWFRCNSCYTCLWRREVLDRDPDHGIRWCASTHDRLGIADMVRYLGYSKE